MLTSATSGRFTMSDMANNINHTSKSSTLSNKIATLQSESVFDTESPSGNAEEAIVIFCSYSHCKKREDNVIHLQECVEESCDKFVHQSCFQAMLKKNNVKELDLTMEPTECFCSKCCLNFLQQECKETKFGNIKLSND